MEKDAWYALGDFSCGLYKESVEEIGSLALFLLLIRSVLRIFPNIAAARPTVEHTYLLFPSPLFLSRLTKNLPWNIPKTSDLARKFKLW